jgi:hypothetical protein
MRIERSGACVWLLALGACAMAPVDRPATEPDAPACQFELTSAGRRAWSMRIGPDRIQGDKTRLTLDGEALYGTLFTHATRLRIEPARIRGQLAGQDASLHLERGPAHSLVRGHLDKQRFLARIDASGLELLAGGLLVDLSLVPATAQEDLRWADPEGQVVLTARDCDPGLLLRRVEVLVVLGWLVHHPDQPLPIGPEPVSAQPDLPARPPGFAPHSPGYRPRGRP